MSQHEQKFTKIKQKIVEQRKGKEKKAKEISGQTQPADHVRRNEKAIVRMNKQK